jgi:hypothetical protein
MSRFETLFAHKRAAEAQLRDRKKQLDDKQTESVVAEAELKRAEAWTKLTSGTSLPEALGDDSQTALEFLGLMKQHGYRGSEYIRIIDGEKPRRSSVLSLILNKSTTKRPRTILLQGYRVGRVIENTLVNGHSITSYNPAFLCVDETVRQSTSLGICGVDDAVVTIGEYVREYPVRPIGTDTRDNIDSSEEVFTRCSLQGLLLRIADKSIPQ